MVSVQCTTIEYCFILMEAVFDCVKF
jgi:hypothetical protein